MVWKDPLNITAAELERKKNPALAKIEFIPPITYFDTWSVLFKCTFYHLSLSWLKATVRFWCSEVIATEIRVRVRVRVTLISVKKLKVCIRLCTAVLVCVLDCAHLCPSRKASPPEGRMSPVSILKVVVFPAPFIPSRPKHYHKHKHVHTNIVPGGYYCNRHTADSLALVKILTDLSSWDTHSYPVHCWKLLSWVYLPRGVKHKSNYTGTTRSLIIRKLYTIQSIIALPLMASLQVAQLLF